MGKNLNGEGTISPRKTNRGIVYDVRLSVRDRRTGLTERISKGGFPTQKAAAEWRDTMKRKAKAEGIVRQKTLTVPDLVAEWIRNSPPPAESTRKDYLYLLDRHIRPRLNIPATQLTKGRLMDFIAGTLDVCQKGPGHGANRTCKAMLKAAYRWGTKPSVGLVQEVPESLYVRGLIPKPKRGKAMPLELVGGLMAAAEGQVSWELWRLLLETAARKGEILGLDWIDLDTSSSSVKIEKIATNETRGKYTAPRTKGKAFRSAGISPELLASLESRRGMPHEPIFPGHRGRPRISFSSVDRWWHRDCKKAGITGDYVPHSLRHTWATTALKNGVSIKVVSSILGHAQVSTTADIYVHDTPEERASASALVANIFFPAEL